MYCKTVNRFNIYHLSLKEKKNMKKIVQEAVQELLLEELQREINKDVIKNYLKLIAEDAIPLPPAPTPPLTGDSGQIRRLYELLKNLGSFSWKAIRTHPKTAGAIGAGVGLGIPAAYFGTKYFLGKSKKDIPQELVNDPSLLKKIKNIDPKILYGLGGAGGTALAALLLARLLKKKKKEKEKY